MLNTVYLLYLDRYHREDLLFFQGLTRAFAQAGLHRPPCLLLHGSGEKADRLLESEGYRVVRKEQVLVPASDNEGRLIERAMREENKKLVATLTESGVSALGVHGFDRGLLKYNADGVLHAPNPSWLFQLPATGAIPVLSTLVKRTEGEGIYECAAEEVIRALFKREAIGDVVVVFLHKQNRPGILVKGEVQETCTAQEAVATGQVPEPSLLARVAAARIPILLTNLQQLLQEGTPAGTTIVG